MISRNTKQKKLISTEIKSFNRFFNADELYDRIRKKDKKIGIATIYRALRYLKKNNELCSYVCERKIIYSKDNRSHCHFICDKCNKIEHINLNRLDFLKKYIHGELCYVQIDVSGICEKCKK